MNLLMLARFLSTCVQTTFRLTSAFLWLVLIRLELFLVFFPILNNQQKQSYSINLYYLRKQMSQKLVIIRNYQTQARQTASYVQQRSDSIQEPGLVMYQCLRSIVRKQSRYPFQLLKQYILFSDQESSIEVGYKHMRHQLELIQVNLKAFCSLMRQKMLVAGFLAIKHDYQKQLRVEAAYGNIQNIETLTQSIGAVSNLHRLWLQWQFFGKLYENYKGFKLSKINLSKIDLINNDYTSKELMEFEPFLSDKIEVINSFIIDKNSEHNYEEEVEVQEDEIVVQRLNVEKKSQVKSYAFKDDRVISQRSVGKVTPATDKQSNQKQVDDLSSKIFVTHKKESGLLQHMSNNKYRTDAKQKQYIYLIRDYRQRRGTPSNYIKIPVNTENVEIVEVHTQKKKKKKSRRVEIEEFCLTQNNCQNCKFCSQYRERREIMKTVTQKLEIIRSTTTNTVGEIRSDFLGEFSQNDTEGKSSSYYKSAHTAYTHLQFSAK